MSRSAAILQCIRCLAYILLSSIRYPECTEHAVIIIAHKWRNTHARTSRGGGISLVGGACDWSHDLSIAVHTTRDVTMATKRQ